MVQGQGHIEGSLFHLVALKQHVGEHRLDLGWFVDLPPTIVDHDIVLSAMFCKDIDVDFH